MTTIEHLAIINLRLARKCAKLRDELWTLEHALGLDERRAHEAEAKLADAERRLRDANNDRLYHCAYCGETGDMSAIADHSKVCAKHPTREVERERDAEKARADKAEDAARHELQRADILEVQSIRAQREVERLTKERNAWSGRAGNFAGGEELAKREVERLQRIAFPDGLENDAAVSAKWFMSERKFYSAEVERLRGIIGRARAKGESDGTSSAGAVLFNVCAILREADVPTVPSGFPGNLLREADAPPAKPRRMKANAPQQGRQSSTLSEDVGKL